MSHIEGTTVEKEITWKDTDGDLADPDTVTATAKDPNGGAITADSVLNPSVGISDVLYADVIPGLYFYRVVGAGNGVDAVVEGTFCVKASSVI